LGPPIYYELTRNRFFTPSRYPALMIRAALIFVVLIALGASYLGRGPEPSAGGSAPPGVIAVSDLGNSGAELSSLDAVPGAGGALSLDRQLDGHFYADVMINGATIRMLVDTGASAIALSRDDARRAGVGISIGMPNVVGQGASGDVKGEFVTLGRVALAGESAENVPAVVLDGGEKSLLGQAFLAKFASVEIRGDTMVLR
jgi:aspartyl protease family protein